jgi:hypothetical protein
MKKFFLLLTAMLFFALGSVLVAADMDSCFDEEGIDIPYGSYDDCYIYIEDDCMDHCDYGYSECYPYGYGSCHQVNETLWEGHCACEIWCHTYWPAYASNCTTCGEAIDTVLDDDDVFEGDGCVSGQCCENTIDDNPTVNIDSDHYYADGSGYIYPVATSDDDPIKWYLGNPFESGEYLGETDSGETFNYQTMQPSGTIYALVRDTTITGLKGIDWATFSEGGVPEFTIIGMIAAISILGIVGAVVLFKRNRRK